MTPDPDVKERLLVEGVDEYLIMCSDGVWEFISDQEAVDIVSRFPVEQVWFLENTLVRDITPAVAGVQAESKCLFVFFLGCRLTRLWQN